MRYLQLYTLLQQVYWWLSHRSMGVVKNNGCSGYEVWRSWVLSGEGVRRAEEREERSRCVWETSKHKRRARERLRSLNLTIQNLSFLLSSLFFFSLRSTTSPCIKVLTSLLSSSFFLPSLHSVGCFSFVMCCLGTDSPRPSLGPTCQDDSYRETCYGSWVYIYLSLSFLISLLNNLTIQNMLISCSYSGPYVGDVAANTRLGIPALNLEDGPQVWYTYNNTYHIDLHIEVSQISYTKILLKGIADNVVGVTCWPSSLAIAASWYVHATLSFLSHLPASSSPPPHLLPILSISPLQSHYWLIAGTMRMYSHGPALWLSSKRARAPTSC